MQLGILSFGLLLLINIQSCIVNSKDPNNSDECYCGVSLPGQMNRFNKKISDVIKEENDPWIPYQPNRRPWLVIIEVKDKNNTIDCTGAIVSPKYIITSKSCLCMNKFSCNIPQKKKQMKKLKIKVIYGENYYKPKNIDKYRNVKNIKVPPFSYHYTDILILELDQKIKPSFEANPICLIQGNMTDENVDVKVSGYNFGEKRKKSLWCITVRGPNLRTPCKFPFIHGNGDKEEIINECTNSIKPPAAQECRLLMHTTFEGKTFLPSGVHAITIIKQEVNGTRYINCFDQNTRTYGWCGTVDPEATKGEGGYNSIDYATNSSKLGRFLKEMPRPTAEDGWGFCSNACAIDDTGNWLLEKDYKVLPHKICYQVNDEIKIKSGDVKQNKYHMIKKKIKNQYSYMCLYKKRQVKEHIFYKMSTLPGPDIQNHPDFRKYYKNNKNKFDNVFHLMKENTTKMYAPKETMYLINDAGSPVFMWKKNEEYNITNAILVGIMSISLKNRNIYEEIHYNADKEKKYDISPLLVSRVKPLMVWIKKIIAKDKTHKCLSYDKIYE